MLKNEGLIGFVYGALLAIFAFLAAGMGHGTYVLAGLVSAPIGAIGIPAAFYGAPVLWSCTGLLLRNPGSRLRRLLFLCLVVTHYLSSVALLTGERYGDWKQFVKGFSSGQSATVLVVGLLFYLLGQVVIWVVFLKPDLRETVKERSWS